MLPWGQVGWDLMCMEWSSILSYSLFGTLYLFKGLSSSPISLLRPPVGLGLQILCSEVLLHRISFETLFTYTDTLCVRSGMGSINISSCSSRISLCNDWLKGKMVVASRRFFFIWATRRVVRVHFQRMEWRKKKERIGKKFKSFTFLFCTSSCSGI